MKTTILIACLAGFICAGPVEDLQPRNWCQVPNTHMDALDPCPADNCSYTAVQGVSCVMDCWNGGVYDTQRDRLIVWGGGHNGYCGNEIYAFSMNTLTWARIWGPSQAPPFGGTHEAFPDGSPGSRHTYDNLAYDPARDVLFSNDGSLCFTGYGSLGTWEFRFSSNTWSRRTDVPGGGSIFTQTAYNPLNGHIFVRNNNYITEFNPASNAWTNRSTAAGWGDWQVCGEIDPVNRVMVFVGGGKFNVFNLTTYAWTSPAVTGATEINGVYAPGLAWDSRAGKLVAWGTGETGAVYVLHIGSGLSSFRWEKITAISSTVPTTRNGQGTYGRFQYCPDKNVFVVVNRTNENVFIYKLDNLPPSGTESGYLAGAQALDVFPNPVSAKARFRARTDGMRSVAIYDMAGRLAASWKNGEKEWTWDASHAPAGLYVAKMSSGSGTFSRTLMVLK